MVVERGRVEWMAGFRSTGRTLGNIWLGIDPGGSDSWNMS